MASSNSLAKPVHRQKQHIEKAPTQVPPGSDEENYRLVFTTLGCLLIRYDLGNGYFCIASKLAPGIAPRGSLWKRIVGVIEW